MDGLSNKHAGGIRVVLQSPKEGIIECAVRLQFSMTNNKAEYEANLIRLDLAKAVGTSSVILYSDSQVVVGHINGDYEAKGKRIKKYLDLIRKQMNQTFAVKFLQVPREENEHANQLAKATSAEHITVD